MGRGAHLELEACFEAGEGKPGLAGQIHQGVILFGKFFDGSEDFCNRRGGGDAHMPRGTLKHLEKKTGEVIADGQWPQGMRRGIAEGEGVIQNCAKNGGAVEVPVSQALELLDQGGGILGTKGQERLARPRQPQVEPIKDARLLGLPGRAVRFIGKGDKDIAPGEMEVLSLEAVGLLAAIQITDFEGVAMKVGRQEGMGLGVVVPAEYRDVRHADLRQIEHDAFATDGGCFAHV